MSPLGDIRLLQRFSATTAAVLQLLDAGYPFQKAVVVLADFEKDKGYRARLLRMGLAMDHGGAFHETLRHILPTSVRLAIWDVAALPDMRSVLTHLGAYVSQKEKALGSLFKSLVYPFVLFVGLILVMLLFVFQVVPAMGALVEGSGEDLLLSVLSGLRSFCLDYIGLLAPVLFGLFGMFLLWGLTRGWSRFLGRWFRPRAADVAWIMGILLSNGVSMERALVALTASSDQQELRWLQADVLQSGQFSSGFLRFFGVTGIQSQLLLVSEKSGTLSSRLLSVGQALLVEDMQRLSRRIGLIQPVLLLVVGVMVWLLMKVVMAPLSTMIQMI